jgi:hypothetical protein
MTTDYDEDFIPIGVLNLSPQSFKALMEYGVISIRDCLDFFDRARHYTIGSVKPSFLHAMVEVLPRLIELGYLPVNWRDENAQF